MREIEGIEEVIERLQPYWSEIHAHFEHENERFKALIQTDHDDLGRILKCHLVLERYLDSYLLNKFGIEDLSGAKLTFFQKAKLLPTSGSAASFVKPGILSLNTIRNRFGHRLQANVEPSDMNHINAVLAVARRETEFNDDVSRIEAFTTIACTWLIVPPPNLEEVFVEAFSAIRIREP